MWAAHARLALRPSAALDARDPVYVELPVAFEARFVRLADDKARGYLGSRVDLAATDIAVALIDDEARFYFIVARRFSFRRFNPEGG